MTPTLAPGATVRHRDTGEVFAVEAVVGNTVYLKAADGQLEAVHAADFRPLLEVVEWSAEPATPEGVQDFIARTLREAAR